MRGRPGGDQLLESDAESVEVLAGEVDPAGSGVFGDVAEDVRQLQGHAAALGQPLGEPALGAESPDMQAAEADGGGDPVAIAVEVGERREWRGLQVHPAAVDHFVQVAAGDRVAADGVGDRRQAGPGDREIAVEGAIEAFGRQESKADLFISIGPGSSAMSSV